MVTEPTHIDGGVLDIVLADVPGIIEIVCSPLGTSDHYAVFIDVVLNQPISHLVCRQEVYIKNSVNWEGFRRDMKGLSWNEIIKPSCPVSSVIEAPLSVIRGTIPK